MGKDKCDVVGCDNEAVFYDCMDNKICEDCKKTAIDECGFKEEDFEKIKGGR